MEEVKRKQIEYEKSRQMYSSNMKEVKHIGAHLEFDRENSNATVV